MVKGKFRSRDCAEVIPPIQGKFEQPCSSTEEFECGTDVSRSCTKPSRSRFLHHLRRLIIPILLGQLLSILIAVTGITSTKLINLGIHLPLTQNLPSYFLLTIVYGALNINRLVSSRKRVKFEHESTTSSVIENIDFSVEFSEMDDVTQKSEYWFNNFKKILCCRKWHYFLAGTIDVHSNWAIVSAYNYTNLTSVQLLDCLTIPTAMILSRCCLKTKYHVIHICGVLICLLGAGNMVLADYLAAKSLDTNNTNLFTNSSTSLTIDATQVSNVYQALFGDLLVIIGAIGYGVSNVYQEYLVRKYGMVDYLSLSSLSATFWIVIYGFFFEYNLIVQLINSEDQSNRMLSLLYLMGFAVAMFSLYTIMPLALSRSNAVLVNLSLLTADLYALLIGIFLFNYIFHPLYMGAFGAIVVGLCLFASRDPIFQDSVFSKPDDTA